MPRENLHAEVVGWVFDLGNTVGRASAYDRMLMMYWVTVRLVGHSAALQEAKRVGDLEPVPFWKEHNVEFHTMHHKIDVLAARLGFPFHSVDSRAMATARPRERIIRSGKEDEGGPKEAWNSAGPMFSSSVLVSGSQQPTVGSPSAAFPRWSSLPSGRI